MAAQIKDCVYCKHCLYDKEYLNVSRSRNEPIIGGALFCDQPTLKGHIRKEAAKKYGTKVDTSDSPVLVGKVIWVCKFHFFEMNESGKSALEEINEFDAEKEGTIDGIFDDDFIEEAEKWSENDSNE
jgi:hypothetical protein